MLPLRPGGKLPLTAHGCLDATRDAGMVRAWWGRWPTANVGLATGQGLLVVDVDPRHGGTEALVALPELPATREALTGGGGRHLFFRGEARCSAGLLGPGLDIRGAGGYVVAPPSIHPTGARYRWHPDRGLRHPVADAPAWLLDLLRPRVRPAPPPRFEPTPDLARRVERARRYLAARPPAVSGSGGHVATFLAARAVVVGFDLGPETAWPLLCEFNERCEPPWNPRELRHKLDSAARDAKAERGFLLRRGRAP